MSEKNIQLIRELIQAVNNKDDETFESLYDPHVSYHSSGDLANADRSVMLRHHYEYSNALSDLTLTLEDVFSSGDKVAYRLSWTGTHTGDLFGVPPTNRKVTSRSISISRISGGKIVEEWEYGDDIDLMEQIGIAPHGTVAAQR